MISKRDDIRLSSGPESLSRSQVEGDQGEGWDQECEDRTRDEPPMVREKTKIIKMRNEMKNGKWKNTNKLNDEYWGYVLHSMISSDSAIATFMCRVKDLIVMIDDCKEMCDGQTVTHHEPTYISLPPLEGSHLKQPLLCTIRSLSDIAFTSCSYHIGGKSRRRSSKIQCKSQHIITNKYQRIFELSLNRYEEWGHQERFGGGKLFIVRVLRNCFLLLILCRGQ